MHFILENLLAFVGEPLLFYQVQVEHVIGGAIALVGFDGRSQNALTLRVLAELCQALSESKSGLPIQGLDELSAAEVVNRLRR